VWLVAAVIALNVWWTSNTIAHAFIHRPFFRRRAVNLCCRACLSVIVGVPQSVWRDRHLAHHAGVAPTLRISGELALQVALILASWAVLGERNPVFFATVYAPGYFTGLVLCAIHGHYEHAQGTTSHYGALYNFLCFNDGYHVEHHLYPGVDWRRLPQYRVANARASRWPAPLRWLERANLEALERLVLHSRALQAFVLRAHRRALESLLGVGPAPSRIAIVGGGLFPRTAIILTRLLPAAEVTVIDASAANLERARRLLADTTVRFVERRYDGEDESGYDLLVVPLAFDGNRDALYVRPPAPTVLVHDWIWHRKGTSRIVSLVLLKRLNLIRR